MMRLDLNVVETLTGGKLGVHDVPCPLCGPLRRKPGSQRKQVLRIWRNEPAFATYHCARCGEKGYVRDGTAVSLDPAAIARAKAEVAERDRVLAAERLSKAKWLWAKRRSIYGSLAETYLREARGYQGAIPSTLAFLPARGEYGPAMIAAFGIPDEPEPGHITIADDAVRGVHLTRLAPDGSDKAGTDKDKIMIGMSADWPIVLAAPNDLLGLAVTEGIENALSVHEVTGLGAWAGGSASRLPALASAIPDDIETVKIIMDDDADGRRFSGELAARLSDRNIEVRLVLLRAPIEQSAA
jgi:hypothetical protein